MALLKQITVVVGFVHVPILMSINVPHTPLEEKHKHSCALCKHRLLGMDKSHRVDTLKPMCMKTTCVRKPHPDPYIEYVGN